MMSPLLRPLIVVTALSLFLAPPAESASRLAETLALADAAFAADDWQSYAAAYRELSMQSPDNGEYWYRLGRAQQELGELESALASLQRAHNQGYLSARSLARMASIEAKRGHAEAAVALFERARQAKLVNAEQTLLGDPALSALLAEPRWRQRLFPTLDKNATRLQRWQTDLEFLDKRIRETHWQFFAQVEQSKWEAEVAQLRTALPALPDWRVSVRLMELVRLGRSGHTHMLPPFQGPDPFHAVDIRLGWFADGLFVTAAPPNQRALVGRRVLKVGSGKPDAVLASLMAVVPHDSPSGLRQVAALFMTVPELLMHYGYAESRESLSLTLATSEGGEERLLLPATALSMATLQSWMQYAEAPADWITARTGHKQPTPLWLQHTELPFWLAEPTQNGLLYAQFNAVRDGEQETLANFAGRLYQALQRPDVEGLILDLRHNRGGNGELLEPLLQAFISVPKLHTRGHFYVLTSGRTFSAAVLLIGDLERQLDPVFVGELSGAGPTQVGEDNMILLPNTGLAVLAASRHFVRSFSDDQRSGIAPHIAAPLKFADYQQNRDPALAAIAADHRAK